MYAPPGLYRPGEIIINPWAFQSLGVPFYTSGVFGPAAGALPAANVAMFIPFQLPETLTVTKLGWGIGAAAGNLDAAVYDEAGNVLVSTGSTLAAGTNNHQVVDVTDTVIGRGAYYLCLVGDTVTTLTIVRSAPAVGLCQGLGMLEQAGVTLPLSTGANPATFAKYTRAYVPMVWLQGYRTLGPT